MITPPSKEIDPGLAWNRSFSLPPAPRDVGDLSIDLQERGERPASVLAAGGFSRRAWIGIGIAVVLVVGVFVLLSRSGSTAKPDTVPAAVPPPVEPSAATVAPMPASADEPEQPAEPTDLTPTFPKTDHVTPPSTGSVAAPVPAAVPVPVEPVAPAAPEVEPPPAAAPVDDAPPPAPAAAPEQPAQPEPVAPGPRVGELPSVQDDRAWSDEEPDE